mmetsp:Transcript_23043/g.52745  ORF Transcript_23043/g.52745 Transcript_23043/m.52745 type:complete len:136 (-) Transcript_23043:145-552(-)
MERRGEFEETGCLLTTVRWDAAWRVVLDMGPVRTATRQSPGQTSASLAGRKFAVAYGPAWYAALGHEPRGNRRTEPAVVGQHLSRPVTTEAPEARLVAEEETDIHATAFHVAAPTEVLRPRVGTAGVFVPETFML